MEMKTVFDSGIEWIVILALSGQFIIRPLITGGLELLQRVQSYLDTREMTEAVNSAVLADRIKRAVKADRLAGVEL